MKKYNIAVVGASGNVGREILNILDFRTFPFKEIYALASSKSEGQKLYTEMTRKLLLKIWKSLSLKM